MGPVSFQVALANRNMIWRRHIEHIRPCSTGVYSSSTDDVVLLYTWACTQLHSCKGTQTRTDCAKIFFFLSFAHLELHQTILLFIPSHIVCFLLEDRNTIRRYWHTHVHTHTRTHTHTHTNTQTHTLSPKGHVSRCLTEAEQDSFEYKQRATEDNCSYMLSLSAKIFYAKHS